MSGLRCDHLGQISPGTVNIAEDGTRFVTLRHRVSCHIDRHRTHIPAQSPFGQNLEAFANFDAMNKYCRKNYGQGAVLLDNLNAVSTFDPKNPAVMPFDIIGTCVLQKSPGGSPEASPHPLSEELPAVPVPEKLPYTGDTKKPRIPNQEMQMQPIEAAE
jgi:hypothetical protein